MKHSVQHRQEREDRKAAKKARELRQKLKQLERTVARQQKIIAKLQGEPEGSSEPAVAAPPVVPTSGPSESPGRARRPSPGPTGPSCCDAPDVREVSLIGRNYRVCRNCQSRSRVG